MKFGRCLWVVERDLDSCSVLSLYDWKMTIYRFVRNVGWCREECYKERPEIAARICTHFLCPQGSFLRWGRLLDARVHWYGKMMRTLVGFVVVNRTWSSLGLSNAKNAECPRLARARPSKTLRPRNWRTLTDETWCVWRKCSNSALHHEQTRSHEA